MSTIEIAGSGELRVTTAEDVERAILTRDNDNGWSDSFETQIGDFWANLAMTSGASNPTLIERVWVANRCQHMNSNAISTMPLRHYGGAEPAWVANPDPAWYPNGIADAMYAIVWSMYGWGDAFLLVTDRYASGYPSAWTVLDPAPMDVTVKNGKRQYKSGSTQIPASDVIQLTRNPTGAVRGTSAIRSYAAYTNGILAASDLGRVMMGSGGTPNAVIKSKKKINSDQATAIQEMWMSKAAARRGAPAVLGPDLEFEQLAFSPADMLLLEAQGFDATVVATAYGMPAQMLNLGIPNGGLNYQTPVLLLEQWWRTELRTTSVRVGQGLSANMLPRGQYVEIDARAFLAPSFGDLVEAWKTIVQEIGGGSVEEFRAAVLNLPPMEQAEAVKELAAPPSAGASPAQQSPSVVELRPTTAVST